MMEVSQKRTASDQSSIQLRARAKIRFDLEKSNFMNLIHGPLLVR